MHQAFDTFTTELHFNSWSICYWIACICSRKCILMIRCLCDPTIINGNDIHSDDHMGIQRRLWSLVLMTYFRFRGGFDSSKFHVSRTASKYTFKYDLSNLFFYYYQHPQRIPQPCIFMSGPTKWNGIQFRFFFQCHRCTLFPFRLFYFILMLHTYIYIIMMIMMILINDHHSHTFTYTNIHIKQTVGAHPTILLLY